MTLLLEAQSAQLNEDAIASRQAFERMLEKPEMAELGLRGLFIEAKKAGQAEAAKQFAQRALAANPGLQWSSSALFDIQCREGDWRGALNTLGQAKHHRHLARAEADRRRALLRPSLPLSWKRRSKARRWPMRRKRSGFPLRWSGSRDSGTHPGFAGQYRACHEASHASVAHVAASRNRADLRARPDGQFAARPACEGENARWVGAGKSGGRYRRCGGGHRSQGMGRGTRCPSAAPGERSCRAGLPFDRAHRGWPEPGFGARPRMARQGSARRAGPGLGCARWRGFPGMAGGVAKIWRAWRVRMANASWDGGQRRQHGWPARARCSVRGSRTCFRWSGRLSAGRNGAGDHSSRRSRAGPKPVWRGLKCSRPPRKLGMRKTWQRKGRRGASSPGGASSGPRNPNRSQSWDRYA